LWHYPAFFDRAGARTGLSAFFGAGTFCFFLGGALALIGSSISRWPSMRLRGFLPLACADGAGCFLAGEGCALMHPSDWMTLRLFSVLISPRSARRWRF